MRRTATLSTRENSYLNQTPIEKMELREAQRPRKKKHEEIRVSYQAAQESGCLR